MKSIIISTLLAVLPAFAFGQSTSSLTVEVSAVTGVSVQGLTVELYGEDSGWVFDPVKVNAAGAAKFSYVPAGVFTLTVDGTPLGLEKYVDANVVHTAEAQTVSVVLAEAVRTPYALNAVVSHDDFSGRNDVALSWNRETDYFFDDFESYEPFAVDFAPWTGYDLDREPAAEISGYYPNRGTQQYATIFNALTIDPPVYYEYEVLRPYSGKQFVGFVRTRSGNANNDWLISPRIKVGVNNVVSFMAKAAEYQPDRFTVCISTTGTDLKDFTQLTPGNYQTVDYRGWQEVTYNLSAYEGKEVYVAIHCVSQNSFMLMVDDFYLGPAELPRMARRVSRRSAANPNETFAITLDGTPVAETADYAYTFEGIAAGAHTLGVTAKYLTTQSEEATIDVDIPAADSFAALTLSVTADEGSPVAAAQVNLLSVADARLTTLVTDAAGAASVPFLAKGQYMVNITSALFDEYNATIDLDSDKTLEVTLTETITDPYNLIYQTSEAEDGTRSVELWWNRDLGFRDSFEDYADFAEQFGDWTVVDGDKMPTYAFSVGGSVITTPASRAELGAMVFNPYSTRPVKASDDGYFISPAGDKYVMFNSAEQALSDDWLITPTLKIGADYVLRFVAKSYDDMYAGSFEFCVLHDGDYTRPEVLDAFYLTSDWTMYELSLAAYEGQSVEVAFHHITYDGWISFLDDVYVGPAEELSDDGAAAPNCTYDVYLDGAFSQNVADTYVRFDGIAEGRHTLGVQAVYASGKKSALTEIEVNVEAGIGDVKVSSSLLARPSSLYDLRGIRVTNPTPGHIYLTPGTKLRY